MWRDWNPYYAVGGNVEWAAAIKLSTGVLQNLKMGLPRDLAVPLLNMYSKGLKPGSRRDTCILMFIITLFTTAEIRKQSKCPPTDEWIEECDIYTMEC